mgnify:CR=1 FL=1
MTTYGQHVSFIWSIAETLRGSYKQSDYGKVVLPFTVLRRLDCVLEGTKDAVRAEYVKRQDAGVNLDVRGGPTRSDSFSGFLSGCSAG